MAQLSVANPHVSSLISSLDRPNQSIHHGGADTRCVGHSRLLIRRWATTTPWSCWPPSAVASTRPATNNCRRRHSADGSNPEVTDDADGWPDQRDRLNLNMYHAGIILVATERDPPEIRWAHGQLLAAMTGMRVFSTCAWNWGLVPLADRARPSSTSGVVHDLAHSVRVGRSIIIVRFAMY